MGIADILGTLAQGGLNGVSQVGTGPMDGNKLAQIMASSAQKTRARKRKKNGQFDIGYEDDAPDFSDATSPSAMAALSKPQMPPMLSPQMGGSPMMGQNPMGSLPMPGGMQPPMNPGPMPY